MDITQKYLAELASKVRASRTVDADLKYILITCKISAEQGEEYRLIQCMNLPSSFSKNEDYWNTLLERIRDKGFSVSLNESRLGSYLVVSW